MRNRVHSRLLSIAVSAAVLPGIAGALTMREAYESVSPLLYGAIGFFGAAAVLALGGGLIIYFSRMALDNRVEGIDVMIKAVQILFVVVILVAVVALIE
ncbi:hypothetical protein HY969_00460 [Candidatus Kaiserbacteria bacterium]|nr:hypothetical protein [Candidatus Kaiserbacteria bacterium]